VTSAAQKFGRIDGLVNNAGILRQITFEDGGEDLLDELWAVNVKAPFRLIRLALPHLRRGGHGRIVNIASTDGKRYRDRSVSVGYAMSKHALVALSHAARFAGWDDGVRVTALCPGAVDTELLAGIPGVVPGPGRIDPALIARLVSLLLSLPNNASIAELPVNTRLESTL
jgi:NAD(P)-dependent dehydrogenase (short-subunit alcohol dehydrogenase family)